MTELETKLLGALKAYQRAGFGNSTDFNLQGAAYDLAVEAIAAAEAAQPDDVQAQAGWKHDCVALLAMDVDLCIDSCPHCGKPRPDAAFQDEVRRAVEAEREACAMVCEDHAMALDHRGNVYIRTWDCKKAASAIRARDNKH